MIVDDTWRVARLPLPQRLLGKAMAWGYRLIGKDRYDDFRLEWVYGLPFMVTPSVFNPKVPRTGQFFASHIDSRLVSRESEVLDMGTGSGVCAVFAANHARRVVAVDINPAAVRCARINALLNNLDHKIEVRHGDLFEPVRGRAVRPDSLQSAVRSRLRPRIRATAPGARATSRSAMRQDFVLT